MSSVDLIKWYNENSLEKIYSTVGRLSTTSIIELLQQYLRKDHGDDSTSLLKGILLGCEKDSIKRGLVLTSAFKEVIHTLSNAATNTKPHTDLICVLNHEVSNLSPDSIVEIATIVLEGIRSNSIGQGQSLKIFSKLLEIAQQHTSLTMEKTSEVVCGTEYKHYVLGEICSMPWTAATTFPLIDMLKDIPLTAEETKVVITKCLEQLSQMTGQTLPPLIYQLIALATACNKIDPVLRGILLHFDKLDTLAPQVENSLNTEDIVDTETHKSACDFDDLKSMEGTVLLYISNTLRQNHSLGKGIMKLIKSAKESASPDTLSEFFLAVGLTLTQDSRFQEEALSNLRLLVLKCFQDTHKTNDRKWLKDHRQRLTDIKILLLKLVKNSAYGWDHVISGSVDLGFNLMASYGPKQGPFKKTFDQEVHKTSSPQQSACDLGSHLLAKTFKLHEISRKEIVAQVINRILISIDSPAYLYIDLLRAIVKNYPQLLLQTVPQVRNMLEDLPLMHEFNVKKLLTALLPLIRISAALRDGLMLTLRKSLSARQKESRHSAVFGFLLILKTFPLSEMTSLSQLSSQSSQSIFSTSSSQIQVDVQTQGSPPRSNELLCLEILQALKRCLKQQSSVRSQLYAGLVEVVKCNPRLAPFILISLIKQLKLYYESIDDLIPPLKLSECTYVSQDSCNLQEPLPVLLMATYMCLREGMNHQGKLGDDDEIIDEVTNENIREIFDSLTLRMCKSDMEDYQLEKSSVYGNNIKEGQKNSSVLCLFMNIYQVLMDYNLTCCDFTEDSVHQVLQLHQSYQKIVDFIQSLKCSHLSGKILLENQLSAMSASNHCNLVYTLFCDESTDNESAVETLSSNDSFLKYVMHYTHVMLLHAKDHSVFPGVGCGTKQDVYSCVSRFARACLHKFMLEKNEPARCPVTLLCLESFHTAVQFTSTWHRSRLSSFLAEICGEDADGTQGGDKVTKLIKRFQRIVMSFLAPENSPLSAVHRKILSELFSVLDTLFDVAYTLSIHDTLHQCTEWFYKLCVEYKIEEHNAAKRLLQSHLSSSLRISPYAETCFRELCFDLRTELGSIEEVESSEKPPTYQLVSSENAQYVLVAVSAHAENLISDCDWLLHHLKGRLVAHGSSKDELVDDDDSLHEARRQAEGSICGRVCTMAVGLLELAQCSCQSAANVDNVLKTFITVFTFLANLSKYYQWLYGQGLGHVPSRFEKLTNFIGSELMRPIYGFITYAESAQTERLETVKAKQDSKKNKKKATSSLPVSTLGKAKVLREMKGIARLVFAIEQHEHHLILLGRKAKIDFMRNHHLPTSRDFRIRSDVLRISLAEQEALSAKDVSRDENGADASSDDEDMPSSKRSRLSS
uniref:Fanconi anemia group I protein-like n=1 Tax=Phallusia mammillata TaxID=59560 RepID=A0A6F9DD48_9ASCI|nr:Fanconi anemia group I protein-like [Phallusia mammillata]